ncbi:metallophosphoesterase [Sunxiuqinia indica]|uniref:metallophosphoesterase n=1 Tax=Sunxiuqinia indica TaxID=2692584 RepID=UPI00135C59A8|nr:metallophosphoesterase [Sunxiuqinia indica]
MISKQLLFFGLFVLAVEYYAFTAVKTAIKNISGPWAWVFFGLYFVLALGALWSLFAFPHWAKTSWPSTSMKYIVNIFIGVFLGQVLMAVIMLVGDILIAVPNLFKYLTSSGSAAPEATSGERFISRFTFIAQTALLFGGALAGGLVYGMTNRYSYKIRRKTVSIDSLPESLKGLKIAQISDIHSGSFDDPEAVAEGVATIMREKPDLILFTGDLVNDKAEEIKPYLNIFKKLEAPMGVYSILGNHDYGDYHKWPSEEAKQANLKQLKQQHAEMGWRLLLDEHLILTKGDQKLALIGVENWGAKGFTQYGDLDRAMQGLEESEVQLKILMSHDPSHWEAQVREKYRDINLTLSGHTHGMQFGIEIPGLKWSPVQYMYKQWAGLYQQENQYLYVNRGFGFIGYQGRLGILPEITILELA